MPKLQLTDKLVVSAKAAPGERLELWDLRTPGLCLRVTERGLKTFVLRYRASDGSQPRFKLGRFPHMSLRSARIEAGRIRGEVEDGRDPAASRRRAKVAADAQLTFEQLYDQYVQASRAGEWKPKGKRKREVTIAYEERLARRHVIPNLGQMILGDINRKTVKDMLRSMVGKGIGAQTNRCQALVRQVFAYGISEDLVQINPATGFAPFADQQPRTRTWATDELTELWRVLNTEGSLTDRQGRQCFVGRQLRIAVMLCALLLQRRSEIAGMQIAEINFDDAVWTIPAHRMKGGRPHSVPLPPRSMALIEEAIGLAKKVGGADVKSVFPNARDADSSVDPMSLSRALARLSATAGIEGATLHDLRRTGATALTSERLGVSPFIRSKVLGHVTDAGGGAAVSMVHYDTNEYLSERRKALEAWERRLMEIVDAPDPAPARPLHGNA
jgi:integrase